MLGAPESSTVTMSEKARPIQSADGSPPRFSKRRMVRRSGRAGAGERVQATAARNKAAASSLQYTRLRGQQLLEFRRLAHGLEFGILLEFLAVLEAFLEGLAEVLQRELVAAVLRVDLGEVVVELGAVFDAAL